MAIEVLIRLQDGTGGRAAGDIVSVKPVPNVGWGAAEGLPTYALIRITNVDLPNFTQYHKRHYREQIGPDIYGARSRYKIELSALSAAVRNALVSNGFYEGKLNVFSGALTQRTLSYISPAGSQ